MEKFIFKHIPFDMFIQYLQHICCNNRFVIDYKIIRNTLARTFKELTKHVLLS